MMRRALLQSAAARAATYLQALARRAVDERAAMRISISSWATTDDDVERSLDAITRVAERFTPAPA